MDEQQVRKMGARWAQKAHQKPTNDLLPVKYKGFLVQFDKVDDKVYAYIYDSTGARIGQISQGFGTKFQSFEMVKSAINTYIERMVHPVEVAAVKNIALEDYARQNELAGKKVIKFVRIMKEFYPTDAEKVMRGDGSPIASGWAGHLHRNEEYVFAPLEIQCLLYKIDGKEDAKKLFFEQYRKMGASPAITVSKYWNPFARYVNSKR